MREGGREEGTGARKFETTGRASACEGAREREAGGEAAGEELVCAAAEFDRHRILLPSVGSAVSLRGRETGLGAGPEDSEEPARILWSSPPHLRTHFTRTRYGTRVRHHP